MIIVGPGRAGGSIALAAVRSGHEIVGIVSRSDGGGSGFGPALNLEDQLPPAELLLIAVRDDAIVEVTRHLAEVIASIPVAAHVSGFTPVSALEPLAAVGLATGGFHPLQTLPDPERGALALAGSYVGIGGDGPARSILTELAVTLQMRPFDLSDESRPMYHAGAAAASNFVITALETAGDLMNAAGIDPGVAVPLVERAVANTFQGGSPSVLTGPIARGDSATIRGQLEAARQVSEDVGDQYRLMAEATAIRAGRRDETQQWS
jgi:predicted short-subunit dehydrogenase-like oxidoreductase (DUF2520 family)